MISVVHNAICARCHSGSLCRGLPANDDLAEAEKIIGVGPGVLSAPVRIIADLNPGSTDELLDCSECTFKTQVVARVGTDKGGVDDGASSVGSVWLDEDVTEGIANWRTVEDDAGDEGDGVVAIVRRLNSNCGFGGGIGGEVFEVGGGEEGVCGQLVLAVQGGGSLVTLNLVLFGCGEIVGVSVGRGSKDDNGSG